MLENHFLSWNHLLHDLWVISQILEIFQCYIISQFLAVIKLVYLLEFLVLRLAVTKFAERNLLS